MTFLLQAHQDQRWLQDLLGLALVLLILVLKIRKFYLNRYIYAYIFILKGEKKSIISHRYMYRYIERIHISIYIQLKHARVF